MRKFILIDQSIKDSGGHHLEYAKRLLRAAKLAGFNTVLCTHKDFGSIVDPDIESVDRAFSHTYWENIQAERREPRNLLSLALRYLKSMSNAKKDQLLSVLKRLSLRFAPGLICRFGALFSYALAVALTPLGRQKNWLKKCFRGGRKIFTGLLLFLVVLIFLAIGLLLAPFVLAYFFFRWKQIFRRATLFSEIFANDLNRMFDRVQIAPGDMVFIPTLGNVELIGVASCARKLHLENISWHFLFRRNLFEFREPAYKLQLKNVSDTTRAFLKYRTLCPDTKAYFYTDTDALTEQYNMLDMFTFKTLPIPLDTSLTKKRPHLANPLTVAYVGDARDEKGFPVLARLVADLRAAGYTSKDICFKFQSNWNVKDGEAGSRIAKAELSSEAEDFVQLLEGPFHSDEYTSLINHADIILVPYDSHSYYARSSGVFAEALAAGIPVVASNKSWMSQALLEKNQAYFRHQLTHQCTLQTVNPLVLDGHSNSLIEPMTTVAGCCMIVEVNQMTAKPGCYLQVRWDTTPVTVLRANRNSPVFRQISIDLRNHDALGLLCVPVREQVLLSFCFDDGKGAIVPMAEADQEDIFIAVHELKPEGNITHSFAATFYDLEEDFSTAVSELIENYPLYLQQSTLIRNEWRDFHSSSHLVCLLDEAAK